MDWTFPLENVSCIGAFFKLKNICWILFHTEWHKIAIPFFNVKFVEKEPIVPIALYLHHVHLVYIFPA